MLKWLVISQIKQLDSSRGKTPAMLSEAWEEGRRGGRTRWRRETWENSLTQTVTEGQPGYEAEMGLEWDQVGILGDIKSICKQALHGCDDP